QLEADGGADPAAIERRIGDELLRLADSGPRPKELERARRRIEATWRWELEDLSSLASGLGTAALWDDWRSWQAEHWAAMAAHAAEITRGGATYLIDSSLTVGWSLPGPGAEPVAETVAPRP